MLYACVYARCVAPGIAATRRAFSSTAGCGRRKIELNINVAVGFFRFVGIASTGARSLAQSRVARSLYLGP